jgi:hypothetical protein
LAVARKVKQFPELPGRSAYPWDDWLDGSIWELTRGVDFKGTPNTFRSNARVQAVRRGGKIRARILKGADGGEKVYIQYHADEEPRATPEEEQQPVAGDRMTFG